MSSDKTTRSASMPGAMVPLRCSSKEAHAGPEVYASIALFSDSRALSSASGSAAGVEHRAQSEEWIQRCRRPATPECQPVTTGCDPARQRWRARISIGLVVQRTHRRQDPERGEPRQVFVRDRLDVLDPMAALCLPAWIRADGVLVGVERHANGHVARRIGHDLPAARVKPTNEPVEVVWLEVKRRASQPRRSRLEVRRLPASGRARQL